MSAPARRTDPVTAIIVGAGHRAMQYAGYALTHPADLRIVGVADPRADRRAVAARTFGFGPDMCFTDADALASRGRQADAILNCTFDRQHVPTALPLLRVGYDMLLEKPCALNEDELTALVDTARAGGNLLMICHVLRYAPFYAAARRRIAAGELGDILAIQTAEHVCFHHLSVSFVRGRHNSRADCGSSMLLAKCCHDLDAIMWLKSGVRPVRVSSAGSRYQFRPEQAPPGAGTRCLVDCVIEPDCRYSARKLHLDNPTRWSFYVWDSLEHLQNPTLTDKEASLKQDNRHGRCIYRCDNDVVDHQAVLVEFADGCTATHHMVGGTARETRTLHVSGTQGELVGDFASNSLVLRQIAPGPGRDYDEERVDLAAEGDTSGSFGGHGGGDQRLVVDFVRAVRREPRSLSCTAIEDSLHGHLACFLADRAMETHRTLEMPSVETGVSAGHVIDHGATNPGDSK